MSLDPNKKAILDKYRGQGATRLVPLAEELGLRIYQTDDLPNEESGMIMKENGHYAIYVNKKHPTTRMRFTIAHEIAHFLLHKDKLDKEKEFIDKVRQPAPILHRSEVIDLSPEEKTMEIEANELAADILMPEVQFKKVWKTASTVEEVAERFNVSVSAASFRAVNLIGETMM